MTMGVQVSGRDLHFCIIADLFSDHNVRRFTMPPFRIFTKSILLTNLSIWLYACGGCSPTFTARGMIELTGTDIDNAFGPQIMSSPAYL
jgi:hypothetical protein